MSRLIDRTAPGIAGLRPYVPGKPVEELERELGIFDSLKLASNENPLGPSPLGWAAVQEAAGEINLYPDDLGYRLRGRLAERHGVAPEQLLLGRGSSEVLDLVARTFLQPGVNAVFSAHAFAMYPIFTQAAGASGRAVPALPADHPEMPCGHDLEAMAEAVDAGTRVVFIANPNNPTGTWLEAGPLEAFLARVPEDVVVVLDEAYFEYVTREGFPDGTAWLAAHPNLLVTRTFSKIYGLAGLRIGYGVGSAELIALLNRARHPFNVSSLALAGAEAALGDAQFIARSVEENARGLVQLREGLAALGLEALPSVANFLCVRLGRPGRPLYEALMREGVIVRPVDNYGLPDCLRVTVGAEEENRRLLEALAKVLEG